MSDLQQSPKFALSIKQPWATLILMGVKTVEIRRWSTAYRGRIYLHAGKIADDRPEGWAKIKQEWRPMTELRGGLIGTIDLIESLTYTSARQFSADRQLHLNDPAWYLPGLIGLRLAHPKTMKFRAVAGQVKLFPVEPFPVAPKPARKRRLVHPPGR